MWTSRILRDHAYPVDLALYAGSCGFAWATAAGSTLAAHQAWGVVARWGYALAALVAVGQLLAGTRARPARLRAALVWLTWAATALLPLVLQAVQRAAGRPGRAQEEVPVIEQAGQRLVEAGTPYLTRAAIAALPEPDRLLGYLPYQPGMALFGLPRAVFGTHWWTDARIGFAVATAAALLAALSQLPRPGQRAAGQRPDPAAGWRIRAVQVATVLPVCALTLATGGDDLPVLALCLLALAWCATGRYGLAGLAAGAAGTLKLFAWPVVAVLLVHALRPDAGSRAGARRGLRFAAGALGLPAAALLGPLLVGPAAVVENVIRFPFGHGLVTSPAQSPLPGHLIATTLPAGRTVAVALLAAAGLAVAAGLLRRPPRTAAAAAGICGYGLLAAILLMPSTRFGYLLYPAAFAVWAGALRGVGAGRAGFPSGPGRDAGPLGVTAPGTVKGWR